MILMTATILLTIDPWLALATLCPFPLIVWLVHRVRSRLLGDYRQGSLAWAEMTSVLADTIPGIRVVKAFAQERREIQRFRDSNDHILHVNDRVNATWAFFGPTVSLLTGSGLLIVWGFAAYLVFQNEITVGVLTAFLAYITRFYARSESILRMYSFTQRRQRTSVFLKFSIVCRAFQNPSSPYISNVRPDNSNCAACGSLMARAKSSTGWI